MSNELLTKELTLNARELPAGFSNFIDALEEGKILGHTCAMCAYGFMFFNNGCKSSERITHMKELLETEGECTPLEYAVVHLLPGNPLDKKGQELLALCKQIREKESTHAE